MAIHPCNLFTVVQPKPELAPNWTVHRSLYFRSRRSLINVPQA